MKTVIPVRISGVDVAGKQFAELVHTLEISYAGVRLGGVSSLLPPGAIVSLQCRLRKCQCAVAWVGGSALKNQVGLRNLEPQKDVFSASLKDQTITDDFVPGATPDVIDKPLSRTPTSTPRSPAPPAGPASLGKRLEAVTSELDAMDKMMQSGAVNPEVLGEFRNAISRVRTTAWALQQWMDLEPGKDGQKNPAAILSYLNAERIAMATRLCESLCQDVQKKEIADQKEKLQTLLTAVETLFTRLAAMDLSVLGQERDDQSARKSYSADRA